MAQKTHYRACHLCEAICGLEIVTEDEQVLSIKGDPDDPFSRGHICPKAIALKDLQEDTDRIRMPLKKEGGEWIEISWDQAFEEIADKVAALQEANGNDALGVYAGNPNVHNYGNLTHGRVLRKALATRNNFSATSLDQLPHHLVALQLFGHQFMVPVPDIDHTDFFLIFGGNPLASNGSMMTVPDVKNRLKAIQKRGGKVVVIDPRRSETAELADQHEFVWPGSDAYVLLAMIRELFAQDLVDTGHLGALLMGVDEVRDLVEPFDLALAEQASGIKADVIANLTRDLAEAKSAACYGRMGVSVQQYGSLCQWAIHILNILTGNLDRVGGVMVPNPAVGYVQPGEPSPGHIGRYHSRVSKLPEFGGEFPATVLAEEIETSGEGQIKALFTLAGNPVLSAPNGRRIEKSLETLDLMVSVDFYINETTRFADYILPPTHALEHDHYDLAFLRLGVRNTTRFNEPVLKAPEGSLHDWEILNQLGQAIAKRKGINVQALPPPAMIVDMLIQQGPYSKKAGHELELNLAKLKAEPHGIDLGPMYPSLKERLCTDDGNISLVSALVKEESQRLLAEEKKAPEQQGLRLIGRRHVRSNNSWMHNSHRLVKGKPRWQCLMHPDDMAERGIADGSEIVISSRVAEVKTEVKASEEMRQGVISLPHGWGHQRSGVKLEIAGQQLGQSVNDLTDDEYYDQSTGNAALNGVEVTVKAASQAC